MGTTKQISKQISRNALFLTLAIGASRLGRLVLVWYIGRRMGAAALGEYGIILTFSSMFQAFGVQGLNPLVMREVAQGRRQFGRFLSNISIISALIALVFVLAMDGVALLLGYPPSTLAGIVVMGVSVVPGTVAKTLEAAIKAREKMGYVALGTLAQSIAVVGLAMLLLHHGYGLLGVFWIFVIGELLLAGAYLLIIDRTIERVRPRVDWGTWRELAGTISTFFGASMAGIGLRRLDVVILSKLRDSTAVGLYTAPFKLVDALMGLRPAIGQAMLPSMARFSGDQRDSLRLITLRSVKFFNVFLLPVALCVTLVSRDVFLRYYSAEFAASGLLLQVLVWSVIPFYVFGVLRNAIIVEGHEKVALRIAVTNLAVSLVLNLVLVPYLGPLGTAISMLVTTVAQAVQAFLFTHRRLMRLDVGRTVVRPCLAMCTVGGLAWLALRWGWSHTAVLPSALVTYAILIFLFRVLSAEEVSFLMRIPRQLGRT